jgi:NTE family protein
MPNTMHRRSALQTIATTIFAGIGSSRSNAQPAKYTRALILGGGSIKGAYQAGVIDTLFKNGFRPDYLYGISAGSLNAAFLADRAFFLGKKKVEYFEAIRQPNRPIQAQNEIVDWPFIGQELVSFWADTVTEPAVLVTKIDNVGSVFNVLTSNFNGLLSVQPLRRLVGETLDRDRLIASPIHTAVGAVNIDTTQLVFAQKEEPYFREFVLASAAIPIAMPLVIIPNGPLKGRYCDGSVKTILPIRHALEISRKGPKGEANLLVCIACQPEARSYDLLNNPGDIIQFVGRISDVASDDIINYDTEYLKREHPGKKSALIRPDGLISIEINKPKLEITNFDANDIRAMINLGRASATKAIETGDLKDGLANGFFG